MLLVATSTCPGPARLPENRLAPLNTCGKTEDRVWPQFQTPKTELKNDAQRSTFDELQGVKNLV